MVRSFQEAIQRAPREKKRFNLLAAARCLGSHENFDRHSTWQLQTVKMKRTWELGQFSNFCWKINSFLWKMEELSGWSLAEFPVSQVQGMGKVRHPQAHHCRGWDTDSGTNWRAKFFINKFETAHVRGLILLTHSYPILIWELFGYPHIWFPVVRYSPSVPKSSSRISHNKQCRHCSFTALTWWKTPKMALFFWWVAMQIAFPMTTSASCQPDSVDKLRTSGHDT